jgi:hypothetical protein
MKTPIQCAKPRHVSADDEVYRTHPAFRQDRRSDWLRTASEPFRKRSFYAQLATFVVVLLLWQLPIINPIKLLVVLFHEMSHVVVAYATGGIVFGIAVDPGGAGITLGIGGWHVLILMAGYVGSLALGALLYALTATRKPGDVWLLLCGLCGLSLLFGWLNSFTAVFGYGALILMVLGGLGLPGGGKRAILRIVATSSCLYPIIDVAGEVVQRSVGGFKVRNVAVGSDVSEIARLTLMSEGLMVAFWVILGLVAVGFLISWSARKEASIEVKNGIFPRRRPKEGHRVYDPTDPLSIPEYTIR